MIRRDFLGPELEAAVLSAVREYNRSVGWATTSNVCETMFGSVVDPHGPYFRLVAGFLRRLEGHGEVERLKTGRVPLWGCL